MCYSLLLVSFKGDKTKQTAECATESEERAKIKEFCEKDQVSKVAVFRCHRHEIRREVWDSVPYSPPVIEEPERANRVILDKAFNNDPKVSA